MENILYYIVVLISMQITVEGMPLEEKSVCPEPSIEELSTLLFSGLSDISTSDVSIKNYHFTCLAVRGHKMYDSFSIVVNFTTAEDNTTQTAQFESECNTANDGMHWSYTEDIIVNNTLSIVFTIPTQTNCFRCQKSKSEKGPGSENIWNETTHCLGQ